MELDTRRYANRIRDAYTLTEAESILIEFGKSLVEAVTPERKVDFGLLTNKPPREYNNAIDTIEVNTKELLGDKK